MPHWYCKIWPAEIKKCVQFAVKVEKLVYQRPKAL